MEISIKKAEIIKKGDLILSEVDEFERDVKRLIDIIENINLAWEGADALKYVNVLRDKYGVGLIELASVLRNYGNYLKNIPAIYTLLDESFANKKI